MRCQSLLATCRLRARAPDLTGPAALVPLCGRHEVLRSEHLRVARLEGTGVVALPSWDRLRALTVVEGSVTIDGVTVARGQTAAIPALPSERRATLSGAHAIVSAVY